MPRSKFPATKTHGPGSKVWWQNPDGVREKGTVLDWLTHIEADLVLVMREGDGAVFARSHWELREGHL